MYSTHLRGSVYDGYNNIYSREVYLDKSGGKSV